MGIKAILHKIKTRSETTDVLRAELELLRERYELVTNNIAAAIVLYTADGEIAYCSPYTQVLTGYTPDEEIEYPREGARDLFEHLVLEQDLERYRRARLVSQIGEDILVRYRIRHRSGLTLWLETRMVPVCSDEGEVRSVMSVTIDVTDSLSYQQRIEEQNRDLNDFAYMVSHDLKAPIFTIKGMAAALVEDYGEKIGDDGKTLLNYIIDGAKRLEQLVGSVLEYSALSIKEGQETDVQLNEVLKNVRDDLTELIRNKKAVLEIQAEMPAVRADPIRIYQVFSNLLSNALKYSSPERAPQISVRARPGSNNYVMIEVQDNGLGIPTAKCQDIFRPYRRAHGNIAEGSGIGLACVKKIVEQVGGVVSVKSVEGQGSTFIVTLPSAEVRPQQIPDDLARLFGADVSPAVE